MDPNSKEASGVMTPVGGNTPGVGNTSLPPNIKPPAMPDSLVPMTLPPPPKSALAPQSNAQPDPSGVPNLSSVVVDDGDLIEKEWVTKAKQIVEKNRNDPYKQSEELTVFKASYMKKRYGKNIKLGK